MAVKAGVTAGKEVTLPALCMRPRLVLRHRCDFESAHLLAENITKEHGVEPIVIGKTQPKIIVPLEFDGDFPFGWYYRQHSDSTLELEIKECSWPGMALAFCNVDGTPLGCYDDEQGETDGVTTYSASSMRWKSNGIPICSLAVAKKGCTNVSLSYVYLNWDHKRGTLMVKRQKVEQNDLYLSIIDHLYDRLDGVVKVPYAVSIASPSWIL